MKTVMQQHLEWLKSRIVVTEQMEQELLEQEKEQILCAFYEGLNFPKDKAILYTFNKSLIAENYYNENYWIEVKNEIGKL
jgi:hypothetical protein